MQLWSRPLPLENSVPFPCPLQYFPCIRLPELHKFQEHELFILHLIVNYSISSSSIICCMLLTYHGLLSIFITPGEIHTTYNNVIALVSWKPLDLLLRVSLTEGRKHILFTIVCVLFTCSKNMEAYDMVIAPGALTKNITGNLCFPLSLWIGGEVVLFYFPSLCIWLICLLQDLVIPVSVHWSIESNMLLFSTFIIFYLSINISISITYFKCLSSMFDL